MALTVAAFAWGLLEATAFYLVPDVLFTTAAVNDLRGGLKLAAASLLGALVGGSAMFVWGSLAPQSAGAFLASVPGISPRLIQTVAQQVQAHGALATFIGPLTATPYKIYAAQSGAQHCNEAVFIAASICARFGRFALLCCAARAVGRSALLRLSPSGRRAGMLAAWLVFYAYFFFVNHA